MTVSVFYPCIGCQMPTRGVHLANGSWLKMCEDCVLETYEASRTTPERERNRRDPTF